MIEGFVYNDGGRAAAGYKGNAGDCACRAITIATERPYKEVYYELSTLMKQDNGKNRRGNATPRDGVKMEIIKKFLTRHGWKWVPTMKVGQGCKVHLDAKELPAGRIIVRISKHITVMIDGVIHDTYDPRWYTVNNVNGNKTVAGRCVYGYFVKE